jgi:class 3 adenylate cyclase/tetratricopeptide (TPR) repeat protein
MECPGCRHSNPPDTKFCGECGTRLQSLCPACQTANPPTNKFCSECGQRLSAATASAPAPAAPAPVAPPSAETPPDFARVASEHAHFASPESYTPKHLAEKILTTKGAMEGERKSVTVMFSDVSGFTAMSEKLDPEDVHGIMDRVFEVILNAVHRYEGTINQFLGDGVMALFGAPIAHEDHVHRALSAALAIQQELLPLAVDVRRMHGVEFSMRMGINTGLVVVGAIGKDLRMDYTAVGDTTNLAARFLGLAKPGQIVVSRRTQHLRDGFFVFEDLGEFQVKGKSEPVRAYALVSEIHGRTRLEVSRERGLTPLVGRDHELAVLAGIHRRAVSGEGAIALLVGEPGVGKSRLLYEFFQRLDEDGALELETTCVSYGRSMAYRPILELLRRYLGLSEGVTAQEVRSRVTDQLQFLGMEGEEPVILLAHFLGFSAPQEFLDRLSGPQLKERTLELLRDVFLCASVAAPLTLIVENMHWVDAASEEFLAHLVRSLPGQRVLLVFTTRPGYAAPWLVPPLAETITIERLEAGDVRGMVRTLLGAEEISEQLSAILAEKSEGNPLYVEEIIRQLRETSGIVVENGVARLSRPDVTVPATIHDIIAARIDRLAEAHKHTLQGASVVGRRFGVSLLSRVLEVVSADPVAERLRELHGLDFVFPGAEDPELMYSFKHALTQDVVYAGLLERRRRQHHAAAARGLEDLYAGRVDDVVELIAYHYGRGQVWDKAVTYLRRAAAKARGKWALREALVSLEEALEALRRLPETLETQQQGIDVRLELRGSLYPLGEFERMATYLREAEAMAGAISDEGRLGLVCIHAAEYNRQTGRFAEARTLAEKALAMGDKLQDVPLQSYAGQYFGLACHALGDYRRASELLRVVTQSPKPEGWTGAFGMISNWDAHQAISLSWRARCLAELGEFDEGVAAGRRAVALAEGLDIPYSRAAACIGLGYVYLVKGDVDAAGPVLERACSIAREANLTLYRPQATRLLGAVYLLTGSIDEGAALVRAAAEEVESKRLLMQHASVLALFGEASLAAGQIDAAANAAQRALTLARDREQRGDAAGALHVLGEAAARGPLDIDKAEHYYRAAIALAGELQMRPLLGRSHLGMGRFYLRAGDHDSAEDHLLTATRLFVSMDMPLWLRQTAVSLTDLGRLVIVAPDQRDLFEYLTRALALDGPLRVSLDVPGGLRIDDERRRQHVEGMLRAHGLCVVGE